MTVHNFAEIGLHKQWIDFDEKAGTYSGTKTPSLDSLQKLINANTDNKIHTFTQEWFPFMSFIKSWEHPLFDDEMEAVKNTRNLMILVLELKNMIDEGLCSKEAFEELGVKFSPGGTKKHEQANLYYFVTSMTLANTIRNYTHAELTEESCKQKLIDNSETQKRLIDDMYLDQHGRLYCPFLSCSFATGGLIKKNHLYLNGQEILVKELDDEEIYPVMSFFGGNLGKSISYSDSRAFFFIDSILKCCIQGLRVETENGILSPKADTNFTSFWICLSEMFRDSRVAICKCCGLPIIASHERGSKRQYCNDSCKRKYKRALMFRRLIIEENLTEEEAAKRASISSSTANRVLGQNAYDKG